MSEKDREMAYILSLGDRKELFSAVMSLINRNAFLILDLGCGIGALTHLLAEEFPSTEIVGLDSSRYLLEKLRCNRTSANVLPVLADATNLPFRPECFDFVATVHVLHEIFHFKGKQSLIYTLEDVCNSLRLDGQLIILDHANPGKAPISIKLSDDLLGKLDEFASKFMVRKIFYKIESRGWVKMSLRDFYDFITKIWALGTKLEEEEMHETHTPFTVRGLSRLLEKVGFKVTYSQRLTPISIHLEHYKIDAISKKKLPKRHLVISAIKKCE